MLSRPAVRGVVQRPSDAIHPHKCVHPVRVQPRHPAVKTIARGVLMYATKTIISREHDHLHPTIFYMDIRRSAKA